MGLNSEEITSVINTLNKENDDYISFHRPGDVSLNSHIPFGIPTGIAELDLALGRDGLPAGRTIEIYGPPHCGKTALALAILAQCGKTNGEIAFIDSEQTFDPARAEGLGVPVDSLVVGNALSLESIFRGIEKLIDRREKNKSTGRAVYAVDSITAVEPEAELKKDSLTDKSAQVGLEAKQIRRGMKKINARLAINNVTVVFVNHAVAANLTASFGKKSAAAGGNALKFFSSIRLCLKRTGDIKSKAGPDGDRLGQVVQVVVEKSKVGGNTTPTFTLDLLDNGGFDTKKSLMEAFIKMKIITKKNQLVFSYKTPDGEDQDFRRSEWGDVIESHGGFNTLYASFIERATESGHIIPWNVGQA